MSNSRTYIQSLSSKLVLLAGLLLISIQAKSQYKVYDDAVAIGDTFRLTDAVNSQAGSVWLQVAQNINYPFTVSGQMFLGTEDAGADGIVFVMQNDCVSGGTTGGGIGYSMLPGLSLGVEFDTWSNTASSGNQDNGDPVWDHVAIEAFGNVNHLAGGDSVILGPQYLRPDSSNVEDGSWHAYEISWNPSSQLLTVGFEGQTVASVNKDIVNDIFGGDSIVYFGFTSSTGGFYAENKVLIDDLPINGVANQYICIGDTASVGFINNTGGLDLVSESKAISATSFQGFPNAGAANDGNAGTRWESQHGVDSVYLTLDLLDFYDLDSIRIDFETAAAVRYNVLASSDSITWDTLTKIIDGINDEDRGFSVSGNYQFVQLELYERSTVYGYSIWEFEVYGKANVQWTASPYLQFVGSDSIEFFPPVSTPFQVKIPDKCNGPSVLDFWVYVGDIQATIPDQSVCEGDSALLDLQVVGNFGDLTYNWDNGVGDMDSFYVTPIGDSTMQVVVTDTLGCDDTTSLTLTFIPGIAPNVDAIALQDTICAGEELVIQVTDSSTAGNNPSFEWYVNGGLVGTDHHSFNTTTFADKDSVAVVIMSNETCPYPATDTAHVIVNVLPLLALQVQIIADRDSICPGEVVVFNVVDSTNGGSDPVFNWYINSAPAGSDFHEFAALSLNDGDSVAVVMLSNEACPSPTSDTAGMVITVLPVPVPSVAISPDQNPICDGDSIVVSIIDSTNGGDNPSFVWTQNGITIGADENSLKLIGPTNGDSIGVRMTSNAICADPISDSTYVIINVIPLLSPTVAILASDDTICDGDQVIYQVVDSTNAGADPGFEWFINGLVVAGDVNDFSSSSLADGDSVAVVIISSYVCPSPETDTTSTIIVVNPLLQPSVEIVASDTVICDGDTVEFTVIDSTNGGSSPAFSWFVNSASVGVTGSVYQSLGLNDGDLVSVQMTSSEECAVPSMATDEVSIEVLPLLAPQVSIVASASTICMGDDVTITVTDITNGGDDPSFMWLLNGVVLGGDVNEISSTSLADGDEVEVVMVSNYRCPVPSSDSSSVFIQVITPVVPDVSIDVDQNPICDGDAAVFTVTDSTNGGNTPLFSWQINGQVVAGDVNSFSSSTLIDGDVVEVIMTSSETCVVNPLDSAEIVMVVNDLPNVVASDDEAICLGETSSISVSGASAYVWDQSLGGGNQHTVSPQSSTVYTVTGTDGNGCVNSDTVIITVYDIPNPSVMIEGGGFDCFTQSEVFDVVEATDSGASPTFSWLLNSVALAETGTSLVLEEGQEGDIISVIMTSSRACSSPVTSIEVLANYEECNCEIFIPTAISPNGDFANDEWQVQGLDCYEHRVSVYNRYGNEVYRSNEYIPWDGKRNGEPLPVATYYYVVEVVDAAGENVKYNGPLTIMR